MIIKTSFPRIPGAVAKLTHACRGGRSLGPGIMATYVDILKSEFPEIDTEVFDYITGEREAGNGAAVCPQQSRCVPGKEGHTPAFNLPVSRADAALSRRAT